MNDLTLAMATLSGLVFMAGVILFDVRNLARKVA